MIARAGSGWQTVLADLSLILFMTTAAVVAEPPAPAAPPPRAAPTLPALGEPVAVWSGAPGRPELKDWLAQTARDPRLRLTIVASPAEAEAALRLAAGVGRPARVLIEPGASGPPLATLTYDQALLAQGLQSDAEQQSKDPTS
ncbi:MAG: hypothetical protein K2W91_12125 [Novosphingobium sp.]|nr:hypothetical protein [Novosphingobium sp.]